MKIDIDSMLDDLNGTVTDFEKAFTEFPIPPVSVVEARANVVFNLCAEKRVVHLGCADLLSVIDDRLKSGVYLHTQLSFVASECIGIDINRDAIAHLHKRGVTNVIEADITKPGITEIENSRWDWLAMPEVLEHVPNPVQFLQAVNETYGNYIERILITTPNAFGSFVQPVEWFAREVTYFDHFYYFTPYTLCKIVHSAGFELEELIMCSHEHVQLDKESVECFKRYPLLMGNILLTARSRSYTKNEKCY